MRRALVIGAETFGLQGVEPDVEDMTAALLERDFQVDVYVGPAADRKGILDAYRRLIGLTERDDAAVVYFAGHGGYVRPDHDEVAEPGDNRRQFIVPTDFAESSIGDFRGVTAVELSVLLAELTEKTDNAAVILDCCHSAVMSRDVGQARVRQVGAVRADLDDHFRRARAAGLRVDLPRPDGNRRAVRLVACGQEQGAYELPGAGPKGRVNGVLTSAFVQALRENEGRRVTWAGLLPRVRQLVHRQYPHQLPSVEGPFDRVLFETATADTADWRPVVAADLADRVAVRVPAELAGTVGRIDLVRVAEPGEGATIEVASLGDGAFGVRDRIGTLLEGNADSVVDALTRIGRAMLLYGLRDAQDGDYHPPIMLEWGLHGSKPLPRSGATLHPGDLVYLRIRNDGAEPIFVSLIDIGVAYGITVMSDLSITGVKIDPGADYVYGRRGAELTWPERLCTAAPRPESILVLITPDGHDATTVHQRGVRGLERAPVRYRWHSIEFLNDPVRQEVA
jgi:hypothetical protein